MKHFIAVFLAAVLLTAPTGATAQLPEDEAAAPEEKAAPNEETTAPETVDEMEPVVVTATRTETPIREVASSITVISEEEIEQEQKILVLDALRANPGLDVVRGGGPGAQTSVFLRGANSEHTLVLIDGIEMNDPISPARAFNFADLTAENIERIEILRGPQSTLYGSDAIGGVINIITKRGEGKPSFYLSGEYGSFETFREAAGVSGGNEWASYSFSVSRLDSDGISAANKKDGNKEEDGYENTSVSTKLGLTPIENFSADFVLRYSDAKADLDGFMGDDPNSTQDTEEWFLRTQGTLSLFDDIWEQTFGVSYSSTERDSKDDPDPLNPFGSESEFEGELVKFDWQHNLYFHETNTLTIGVETEEEKGKSKSTYGDFPKKTARTTSWYVQDQINLGDSLFVTLGIRQDDHEDFGSEVTYRMTAAYLFKDIGTKIKGTYGSGFKAPSLYQLFAPPDFSGPIGNPDLNSEKSRGWDVGIEQELLDGRVYLGATYFKNIIEDLIIFDYIPFPYQSLGYKNLDEAEIDGIELSASFWPRDDLSIHANYTYTDARDKTTRKELHRRPKDKVGLDVNYRFLEKGAANLGIAYVGRRYDTLGGEKLGGYTVVNLAASYDINEHVRIFGRMENLLDREYEEIDGFGTPGFAAFAGLKLIF